MSGLKHWMMSTNALARDFEATLALSPNYDSVRAADPGLTFWATFRTGLGAVIGPKPSFERESDGISRSPLAGKLIRAIWDMARPEAVEAELAGTLLELAITNQCANHSARPDSALTGLELSGDPAATLARQSDAQELRRAGLDSISPDYAFVLDNASGAADAWVNIAGEAGTLNPQTVSAYCRGQGTAEIGVEGVSYQAIVLPMHYARFAHSATPDLVSRRMQIRAKAGAVVYWVLNQFEGLSATATSPIETAGAPTSRAMDTLRWPTRDQWGEPLAPNTQGMAAAEYRLSVPNTSPDLQPGRNWVIEPFWRVTQHDAGYCLLVSPFFTDQCVSTSPLTVQLTDAPAGARFVLTMRWNRETGKAEQGFYYNGVWFYWEADGYHSWWHDQGNNCDDYQGDVYQSYSPSGPSFHVASVRLWNEDRGQTWLENYLDRHGN